MIGYRKIVNIVGVRVPAHLIVRLVAVGVLCSTAALLAACSGDGSNDISETCHPGQVCSQPAISFSAAMAGEGTTRATGDITTNNGLSTSGGFGVFAAYTGLHKYADSNVSADFMYNQQVTSADDGASWTYSPVVYWPNGEGETGGPSAANPHYVSFFAYAPYSDAEYTAEDEMAGRNADYCISGFSYAHEQTDPWLTYRLHSDVSKQVDLLYAVPRIDQTKQLTNQQISFTFNHALACAGDQLTITMTDGMKSEINALYRGSGTSVEVRITGVTVTYTLTSKARLSLWSNPEALQATPNWQPIISEKFTTERTVVLQDMEASPVVMYRYDGTEATYNAWQDSGHGVYYIPIETGGNVQTANLAVSYDIVIIRPAGEEKMTKTGEVTMKLKDYADAYQAGKHLYFMATLDYEGGGLMLEGILSPWTVDNIERGVDATTNDVLVHGSLDDWEEDGDERTVTVTNLPT